MEVEKILRMKEGAGESSYANNSLRQKAIIGRIRPVVEESIREVYERQQHPECVMMADFGCSSGPNALLVVSQFIDIIIHENYCRNLKKKPQKFGVFLNDLPGNDFNTIFKLLPDFYKKLEEEKGKEFGGCFISTTPRSFYGRVYPDNFLHFVHSSSSLHWLSQEPEGLKSEDGKAINKGNIYIAKSSPQEVSKLYHDQFKRDFTLFLRSRAREMVPGGRMVLTLQGRIKGDEFHPSFDLLASAIHDMVLEGKLEEEKVDNFNMPIYTPTIEEVENLVESEGSFALLKIEAFIVDLKLKNDLEMLAEFTSKSLRAVVEPLFVDAFGEEPMDDLFHKYEIKFKESMTPEKIEPLIILLSLSNKKSQRGKPYRLSKRDFCMHLKDCL